MLTHGSLFTGVGGIDRGLDAAGFKTKWQVELNPYCLKVLNKHYPNVPKFNDVTKCGRHNLEPVNIISGGFPCQDVSIAGKRRGLGTADKPTNRSGLWFEFRRIVAELRPPWVLIENVYRLKSNGADQVLADMAQVGYACWPTVVGAENLGAPHERRRVWILCHRNDAHLPGLPANSEESKGNI
jgi:DNA (cytosine-5)-methyltransferase 1